MLLSGVSAHAATNNNGRWVEIGVTPDRTSFDVDATSIRVDGKNVVFWMRQIYLDGPRDLGGPKKTAVLLAKMEVACDQQNSRYLASMSYDETGAASVDDEGISEWAPIAPESNFEAVARKVCAANGL
jgi:hypothetical protein